MATSWHHRHYPKFIAFCFGRRVLYDSLYDATFPIRLRFRMDFRNGSGWRPYFFYFDNRPQIKQRAGSFYLGITLFSHRFPDLEQRSCILR